MHNGKTALSLLYPTKYLNEPLLPYESLLDTTIFLISILSISIGSLQF